MPENILYNLIYALITGLTEFLCVDAAAHGLFYEMITGQAQSDPLLTVFLRLSVIFALILSCWPRIRRLMKERRLAQSSRQRDKWQSDPIIQLDLRVLRAAVVPALIGVLFYRRAGELIDGLPALVIALIVNGVIVFIPRLLSQGNKDGRSVSGLDAVMIGLGSVVGCVPGLSAMSGMLTAGSVRGLDRSYTLDLALLLSVPIQLGLLVFDVVALFTAKVTLGFLALLLYLLCAAVAFGSAWLMIMLMRYLSVKLGYSGFAFYSWGFALFAFILYLII